MTVQGRGRPIDADDDERRRTITDDPETDDPLAATERHGDIPSLTVYFLTNV